MFLLIFHPTTLLKLGAAAVVELLLDMVAAVELILE
jgi:hypothetical protein